MIPVDPDRFKRAMDLAHHVLKGDVVLFHCSAGKEVEIEGDFYAIPDNAMTSVLDTVISVFPEEELGRAASTRAYILMRCLAEDDKLLEILSKRSDGNGHLIPEPFIKAAATIQFQLEQMDNIRLEDLVIEAKKHGFSLATHA